MGRPAKTTPQQRKTIQQRLQEEASVSQAERDFGISRASVISIEDTAAAQTVA